MSRINTQIIPLNKRWKITSDTNDRAAWREEVERIVPDPEFGVVPVVERAQRAIYRVAEEDSVFLTARQVVVLAIYHLLLLIFLGRFFLNAPGLLCHS